MFRFNGREQTAPRGIVAGTPLAYRPLIGLDLETTSAHPFQAGWNEECAASFADWLRRQGGDWRRVDHGWPLATSPRPTR